MAILCLLTEMVRQLSMNNQGFTLVEMLLVVALIGTVIYIFTFNITKAVTLNRVTSASYQIESILNSAQSCAIALGSKAVVNFETNRISVNCDEQQQQSNFPRVTITTNASNNQLSYNYLGNISQGATIDICAKQICKQLTASIGRSSVEIK